MKISATSLIIMCDLPQHTGGRIPLVCLIPGSQPGLLHSHLHGKIQQQSCLVLVYENRIPTRNYTCCSRITVYGLRKIVGFFVLGVHVAEEVKSPQKKKKKKGL